MNIWEFKCTKSKKIVTKNSHHLLRRAKYSKIIFLLTSFTFAFRVIPQDSLITVPIDYNTIQGAINNAEDGFVIVVYPDIFNENIMIDKNITLTSLALFDTTTNSLSVSLETWYSDDYPITITNE